MSPPSLSRIFLAFLKLGAVSFGGPAMVASIERLAVSEKKWLSAEDFRLGVALCQAMPGATAMQSAAYVGLRVRRWRGAVAAYTGFGLPAFLIMFVLAVLYQKASGALAVASVLSGLRALVVAIVAHAAWTFGRTSIKNVPGAAIAVLAALAFGFGVNPILIIFGAALAGAFLLRAGPSDASPAPAPGREAAMAAFRTAAIFIALAGGLLAALFLIDARLATLGFIAMKADLLAFGGGYASVPLLYREIVNVQGWLPSSVFMDGIALGQVTPGPIVITSTFIGYQVSGAAGALVGTVGVFLPSIFIVLLAEPWFRRYRHSPVFKGMTQALVLSFVGLLASVTVQFGLNVPWTWPLILIAAVSLAALLRKVSIVWVVLGAVVLSAVIGLIG